MLTAADEDLQLGLDQIESETASRGKIMLIAKRGKAEATCEGKPAVTTLAAMTSDKQVIKRNGITHSLQQDHCCGRATKFAD